MLGNLAEKRAYDEAAGNKTGRIVNRAQAQAVVEEARRDIQELKQQELEKAKRGKRLKKK